MARGNFKFDVEGKPELKKFVLDFLFSIGYDRSGLYTRDTANFLFCDGHSHLSCDGHSHSMICYTKSRDWFNGKKSHTEIDLTEIEEILNATVNID